MKNLRIYTIIVASTLFLSSCQDIVEVDLPNESTRLVIDGDITNSTQAKVLLTTTASFYNDGATPTVSNAVITMYENGTTPFPMTEVDSVPGLYISGKSGSLNSSYHLEIVIPEGEAGLTGGTYETIPERINRVPTIDSIFVKFQEASLFFDEGYYAFFKTTEPEGIGDFYRWKSYKNGVFQNEPFDLSIAEDRIVDGNTFERFEILDEPSEIGDVIRIEQLSITKNAFDYYALLVNQIIRTGSTFDPPAVAIKGNGFKVGDNDETVLGFFTASGMVSAEITVTP